MSDTTDWLTRPQLAIRTGIPYVTVCRYIKRNPRRFRRTGKGRHTRFHPDAETTLVSIRASTKPGQPRKRPKDPREALADKLEALEHQQETLRQVVRETRRELAAMPPVTAVEGE